MDQVNSCAYKHSATLIHSALSKKQSLKFDTFNVQPNIFHVIRIQFIFATFCCCAYVLHFIFDPIFLSACVYLVHAYRYPICVFNAQQANNLREREKNKTKMRNKLRQ